MYDIQMWAMSGQSREGCRTGRISGVQGQRRKSMDTQRELRALICYLRQQESCVLDAMQRLQDGA